MKVTFLKDFQGPESGNEFYGRGIKADLEKGAWLVGSGFAAAGWGPPPKEEEPVRLSVVKYADWTYRELQNAAKAAGIASNQSRAKLIAALEAG